MTGTLDDGPDVLPPKGTSLPVDELRLSQRLKIY